jgi:hypothetical protein
MLKFRVASNPNVFSNRGGASGVARAIPQLGKKICLKHCVTLYMYCIHTVCHCTVLFVTPPDAVHPLPLFSNTEEMIGAKG